MQLYIIQYYTVVITGEINHSIRNQMLNRFTNTQILQIFNIKILIIIIMLYDYQWKSDGLEYTILLLYYIAKNLALQFATVVGVVLVTELVCGVVAFIFKEQLQAFIEENANLLMKVYNESIENEVKAVWDKMHENFVSLQIFNQANYLVY